MMSSTIHHDVFAQCSATVSTFPYNESFEDSDNGNWISSPSSAWECGTPGAGKQVILTAGGGMKSWVVGGLNSSFYSSGNSELRSPCFDFSSLINPEISFKVFWETELRYDGCTFQYSLDGANTWTTLGSVNATNTCDAVNWFTYSPITPYLNGEPGWSGNVQTGGGGGGNCFYGLGSGAWVTARHGMQMLAGQSNVVFRFYFGAGIQCNDFDGFAVDDVQISETPAVTAPDFTYGCAGNSMAQFTNNPEPCEVAWNWNFGDAASGLNNVSSSENPSHLFSAPGTYSVSLTVNYGDGTQVVIPPKTISILNVTALVTQIKCNGDQNGAINVNVTPVNTYTYAWDTNPPQTTATINNLGAGIYTVNVTAPNACSVSVPVSVNEPAVLATNPAITPAKCGNDNGTIIANVSGGTQPYFYTWSNGGSGAVINNLAAGSYNLAVTDMNGCTAQPVSNIEVSALNYSLHPFLGNDTTVCPGKTLFLKPGQYAGYFWQDNSIASSYPVTKSGSYSVQVRDIEGCTGSDTINVIVDCKGIYFPSAFTPNTDALNSSFGPIGDPASLKNYKLVVYNRYAEIIFSSADPFKKWDGTFKGLPVNTGTYIWKAEYNSAGSKSVFKKGTILVIR